MANKINKKSSHGSFFVQLNLWISIDEKNRINIFKFKS